MDYKKHYDALIERAKCRKLDGYFERHHVIPRCMGGLDDDENLVDLTPEEHFVAHQLLVKINPENPRLVHAANMMTASTSGQKRNNKSYSWIRKRLSESMSGDNNPMRKNPMSDSHRKAISKAQSGRVRSKEFKDNLSRVHKGKMVSEETRLKMSEAHKGQIMPESMKQKTSERVSGSGNPMYGNGHKLSGEKNGMFGNSVNKGKKHFFCVELNKWFMMFPDDERMKTGTWRPGRK